MSDFQIAGENERRELLDIFTRQMPLVLIGGLIVAVINVLTYRTYTPEHSWAWELLWLAAMLLQIILRVYFLIRYRNAKKKDAIATIFWERRFIAGGLISGILFGIFGYQCATYSGSSLPVFTIMMATGMTSGSVASLSAIKGAYPSFAIPIMIPIIIKVAQTHPDGQAIGFFGLVFLSVNLGYSHIQFQAMRELIRLRAQKDRLIDELEQARMIAEEANAAKREFMLSAGHDLRQPLYAMRLLIDRLYTNNREIFEKRIQSLRLASNSISELLDKMLEAAKFNMGQFSANPTPLALNMLLTELRDEFESEAVKKEIEIRIVPVSLNIFCDRTIISHILRNLIANAMRHSKARRLLLGARRQGVMVRIDVIDNGIGIDPVQQTRIFEPFYMIGNRSRKSGRGHGLGLTLSRNMANLIGSELTLQSISGRGSRFSLTLPICQTPLVIHDVETPLALPEKVYILLVEDEDIIRNTINEMLREWGCHVAAYEDAELALKDVEEKKIRIDLIVTDLRLPGSVDGLTLIQLARRQFDEEIPALIVSGDTNMPIIHDAHIRCEKKPLSPQVFRQHIAELLQEKKAVQTGDNKPSVENVKNHLA